MADLNARSPARHTSAEEQQFLDDLDKKLWNAADRRRSNRAGRDRQRGALPAGGSRQRHQFALAEGKKGGLSRRRTPPTASLMPRHRIFTTPFSDVYPLYVANAERKRRWTSRRDQAALCYTILISSPDTAKFSPNVFFLLKASDLKTPRAALHRHLGGTN